MPVSLDILEKKQRLKTLSDALHQYTAPAAPQLIEKKENGDIQCFACGHRCLIKPGRDGVCRVRFNDYGTLKVPYGYVGALACDPIEKKPFYHVLPGSDALTFGMLGCDYHCGYCFTPETTILTDHGPTSFAQLFDACETVRSMPDARIAFPPGRRTIAASGQWRQIEAVFRHSYRGRLVTIRPYYLPRIRCTPDHSVYATTSLERAPEKIRAAELTLDHYLAVPRQYEFADVAQTIDAAATLSNHAPTHNVRWKLSPEHRKFVATATAAGKTSRQIGLGLGKSASYVRHVRAKLARNIDPQTRTGTAIVAAGRLRFAHERQPGIPAAIALDERFATLLGYYCAEGSVVRCKDRPNSYALNFSFSHRESARAEEVRTLVNECLGLNARLVWRTTTLAVCLGRASAALLFKFLAGSRADAKRVPPQLFTAPKNVVAAFLRAYVAGDGHRYDNGKVGITTVSPALARGVAFLALKLGCLPSIYETDMPSNAVIQGRTVRRCPKQITVVWYEQSDACERRTIATDAFHLVPLRDISEEPYDGDVYNMQVETERNYLASFLLVSNCQNWVTSQMLRDPNAVAPARITTPKQLVDLAIQNGAPVVASSYNEPLITSEWAVDVFKEATSRNLKCAYISNGNGTPQVLDFIRPYVEAYKVDLKTFSDKHYRELGGVLDNVTATIRNLKQRNFWVEIVTLLVPNFSDDTDDIKRMAAFLAEVDPLMPWHVTAFHPDYKMTEQGGYRRTTVDDLMKVVEIAKQAGLQYIYPGNLPGQVGEHENTRCHHCHATLIRRYGFLVTENRMPPDGLCPECRKPIPGIWGLSSGHRDGRVRPLI